MLHRRWAVGWGHRPSVPKVARAGKAGSHLTATSLLGWPQTTGQDANTSHSITRLILALTFPTQLRVGLLWMLVPPPVLVFPLACFLSNLKTLSQFW